ncbi:MAG: zonular occludens toxin domain-containing protein [Bacilli bacterium]|nr:zonular occludens toxin domain-containing protein [Bacilli bacterium]
MIWLYSGTPGSGKSFHAVSDILGKTKRKEKNKVIANFPLAFKTDKQKSNFIYIDNSDMTIENLTNYAHENHKLGIEGQTLVVIDEAQILFNSRDWGSNSKKRMAWIKFFSQHRKYGFNFILIAQFDLMIDKQIRALIEYEVAHMKMNNFFMFIPMTFFLCIERWYGQRMKIGHYILRYSKKKANAYNSYETFDDNAIARGIEERSALSSNVDNKDEETIKDPKIEKEEKKNIGFKIINQKI